MASVSTDGTSVLVAPVSTDGQVRQVVSGATKLLRPAWDFADRMWLVDRTSAGARVSFVEGNSIKPLTVAGLTGLDVKDFLVSRDGTRLVAALHGPRSDHLVISRILHDSSGGVLGATRARSIPWNDTDVQRVRDIGWRSPTSVAVLHLLTRQAAPSGTPSSIAGRAYLALGQALLAAHKPALRAARHRLPPTTFSRRSALMTGRRKSRNRWRRARQAHRHSRLARTIPPAGGPTAQARPQLK